MGTFTFCSRQQRGCHQAAIPVQIVVTSLVNELHGVLRNTVHKMTGIMNWIDPHRMTNILAEVSLPPAQDSTGPNIMEKLRLGQDELTVQSSICGDLEDIQIILSIGRLNTSIIIV